MEKYFVRVSHAIFGTQPDGILENLIEQKADRLELRDGALIFYSRDKIGDYKIARVIAAGEWSEIIKVDEDD